MAVLQLSLLLFLAVACGGQLLDESRLYKHLMEGMEDIDPDRVLRPAYSPNETLVLKYGINLVNADFDDDIAKLDMWEKYSWKDPRLSWEPTDFGGVKELRVPIERIWMPDFVPFKRATAEKEETMKALAVVYPDGTVSYIPMLVRKVRCSGGKTMVCDLKLGSWTYNAWQIDPVFFDDLKEVDVSFYTPNKYYDLVGNSATKNTKRYPCCPEPYTDLTFKLEFSKAKDEWWKKDKVANKFQMNTFP